jgi:hypothetical protein
MPRCVGNIAMEETRVQHSKEPRGAGGLLAAALLIVFVGLPVLYVLATGPIHAFYGPDVPNWMETVYTPLSWVLDQSPLLMRAYVWYISFWIDIPDYHS